MASLRDAESMLQVLGQVRLHSSCKEVFFKFLHRNTPNRLLSHSHSGYLVGNLVDRDDYSYVAQSHKTPLEQTSRGHSFQRHNVLSKAMSRLKHAYRCRPRYRKSLSREVRSCSNRGQAI